MEDIKFIKRITDDINRARSIIGNCVYYVLGINNRAKAFCDEYGVHIIIVNRRVGTIDEAYLPFCQYFAPTQCSSRDEMWYQQIDGNHWYLEGTYDCVLPKDNDYKKLAEAMEQYMVMFAVI